MSYLACSEVLDFLQEEEAVAIIAIVLGCTLGMFGIIAGTVSSIVRTRSREASRREIAAYVAEGSITPEDAVAIIDAGRPRWEVPRGCGPPRRRA